MSYSLFLSVGFVALIEVSSTSMDIGKINSCNNFLIDLNSRSSVIQTYSESNQEKSCLSLIAKAQTSQYIDRANPIVKKALLIRQKYVNAEQNLIKQLERNI